MIDAILSWIAANPYSLAWMIACVAIPLALFQVLPLLVLMERRGAGYIQDRTGPHRAAFQINPSTVSRLAQLDPRGLMNTDGKQTGGLRLRAFGMLYNMADLFKLIGKEEFTPPFVFKGFYLVAPAIPVITGLLTPALLPFWAPIPHAAGTMAGSLIESSNGLLLLFALGSLSVYGVVLGSWSSNSKYSLLGGMRASAMMISYEVSMGLAVLGMLLLVGSFNLNDVVAWQGAHAWGIFVQPLGFALFLVAMFAETNRNPFDVAEGESEIVAGFHTEYNGMKFMLFMTAEYLHIIVASILLATIFLGGWQIAPCPLPLNGIGAEWVALDGVWVRDHLGIVAGAMIALTALPVAAFAWILARRRTAILARTATDKAARATEYGVYIAALGGAAVAMLVGGIALIAFVDPEPVGRAADGTKLFSGLVNLCTALVQFHIVIGKALLFCWLFVWVRWTLPRFRYDQIMSLGWKVLLNLALVNLLVTAIVAKLIG